MLRQERGQPEAPKVVGAKGTPPKAAEEVEGEVKTTIEGRVHLHGALLRYLKEHPVMPEEAERAADEFLQHDELAEEDYLEAKLVGHPDECLSQGMILLSCGPVAIECCASELRRALAAFTDGTKS